MVSPQHSGLTKETGAHHPGALNVSRPERSERLRQLCISSDTSIQTAMSIMDKERKGVLFLCEEDGRLVGVVTDADIRESLLHHVPLSESCRDIACLNPVVAPKTISYDEALCLMDGHQTGPINHLPLLDTDGRIVDVLLRSELAGQQGFTAVIMAGGFGMRLRPLTEKIPKPMLPVGTRPLLELIVDQLRCVGAHRVFLTTHYRAKIIMEHFGDGRDFGVEIGYIQEDQPLGTAGALCLLDDNDDPLLVMNGDILTGVNFRVMLEFHRTHASDMTVAVRQHRLTVPYGVLETDGIVVNAIREKPTFHYNTSAGIYVIGKDARCCIPKNQHFDMPDLIHNLLLARHRVVSFPIHEYWLDIGQIEDYRKAQEDMRVGRIHFNEDTHYRWRWLRWLSSRVAPA